MTAGNLALVLWIGIRGQTGTSQVGDDSFLDRRADISQDSEPDASWQLSSPRPSEILAFGTELAISPDPLDRPADRNTYLSRSALPPVTVIASILLIGIPAR